MSDPINTTSGPSLDGLTRLEILEVLRQQAWIALTENAAHGGINVSKLGDYILDLSDAIDNRINENAEKLRAEEKARSEAEMNTAAEVTTAGPFSERTEYEGDTVTAKVHTAGPFAKREEYTPESGDGLLGQIIDKLTAIEKLLKPTGYTVVNVANTKK